MDEDHLVAAARYVALNPVRARLVAAPPLLDRAPNFADLLDADPDDPGFAALRRNELIGRPLGDRAFQDAISRRLGRAVTPGKRGPKPKRERDGG